MGPQLLVTFVISALEMFLLTYLLYLGQDIAHYKPTYLYLLIYLLAYCSLHTIITTHIVSNATFTEAYKVHSVACCHFILLVHLFV